jgi:hypothetical protein
MRQHALLAVAKGVVRGRSDSDACSTRIAQAAITRFAPRVRSWCICTSSVRKDCAALLSLVKLSSLGVTTGALQERARGRAPRCVALQQGGSESEQPTRSCSSSGGAEVDVSQSTVLAPLTSGSPDRSAIPARSGRASTWLSRRRSGISGARRPPSSETASASPHPRQAALVHVYALKIYLARRRVRSGRFRAAPLRLRNGTAPTLRRAERG